MHVRCKPSRLRSSVYTFRIPLTHYLFHPLAAVNFIKVIHFQMNVFHFYSSIISRALPYMRLCLFSGGRHGVIDLSWGRMRDVVVAPQPGSCCFF